MSPFARASAVVFDLDGTLTAPYLDFDRIRSEIGLEPGPILEGIAGLDRPARAAAESILLRHEWEAAENAILRDGAMDVMTALRARGHPTAIVTRNARLTVHRVLDRFGLTVDAIRTRDDGPIKPSGEPILSICDELGADPKAGWMVGDYLFDILAGREAGSKTALIIGDGPPPRYAAQADHVIRQLAELLPLIS